MAMTVLGNGLSLAKHNEDALSVREAVLATMRRVGVLEYNILTAQGNISVTYSALGRHEEALSMRREVYSGWSKLLGEEHHNTLREANNCAVSLNRLQRYQESKSLLRRTLPVARRVLGDSNDTTLRTRGYYAEALYMDDAATLDDLCEAVNTLEEMERTARRVYGSAHPLTKGVVRSLQEARAVLRASEAETA